MMTQRKLRRTSSPRLFRQALRNQAVTIKRLTDENQSLWFLLNEMRASEIEKHGDVLREEIQDIVDRTVILAATNVGEA